MHSEQGKHSTYPWSHKPSAKCSQHTDNQKYITDQQSRKSCFIQNLLLQINGLLLTEFSLRIPIKGSHIRKCDITRRGSHRDTYTPIQVTYLHIDIDSCIQTSSQPMSTCSILQRHPHNPPPHDLQYKDILTAHLHMIYSTKTP